jgi:hypothetical protein
MSGTLHVSGPAQLIEAVPYLLGFAPTESVVIIGLAANRVSVVGRVDLVDGEDAANAVVRQVLGHSDAAAMVVYTERAVPRWISRPSAAVRDALLVSGGRWYSLLCTNPGCCPPGGRELPNEPSTVAACAVSLGLAPAGSREEITASLAPRAVTSDAVDRAAELTQIPARDAAWLELDRFIGDDGALRALASYYLETAQHCPQDATAAAPWFLYAWAQWRLGDGVRAAIALDNLDAAAPGYSATDLLRTALRMGMDPNRAPALTLSATGTDTDTAMTGAVDELGAAVARALDEAHLHWTRDEDSYTVAGCSVALNYSTGRPEVWQVERDADPDRVAKALADVRVAAGGTSQGGAR